MIDEKLKIEMGSYSLPPYKLSIVFFNRKYADSFDKAGYIKIHFFLTYDSYNIMIVLDWGLTTIQEHKDVSKFCDTFSIECLFYKKMLNLLQISL